MILRDIITKIEEQFPPELAYEWDNVGLLAGNPDRDIQTVLVTLDVNSAVAEEAKKLGADLIVSHHPILMQGIKSVRTDTEDGKMLSVLLKNDIAVYAAHTNLDVAPTGINAVLAEKFQLENIEILADEQPGGAGLGRIGEFKESMSLSAFAELCKAVLNTPAVRVSGNPAQSVKRVAIGSGGCGDYIPIAKAQGADVMLTADMKYHPAINAVLSGISVVDAGHYPTETVAMDIFESVLKDLPIKICKSQNKDIFQYI